MRTSLLWSREIKIKATPADMVFEAINHLHVLSMIDKEQIGKPLKDHIEKALEESLRVEEGIGKVSIDLQDISHDKIDIICSTQAPHEPGSPDRYWMKTVKDSVMLATRTCVL